MSIGSWVVLALVVIVATGYFIVTQTKEDIDRRAKWGGEREELGLIEALTVLWREAVGFVQRAFIVQQHYKHKPMRKHSAAYLGKKAVRVTTLQTVAGR